MSTRSSIWYGSDEEKGDCHIYWELGEGTPHGGVPLYLELDARGDNCASGSRKTLRKKCAIFWTPKATNPFEGLRRSDQKGGIKMRSALPGWLRIVWLCFSPVGVLFAARIGWEKTVWRWSRGPQSVGFSLLHIHPFFAMAGILCCYVLMLWLVPASIFVASRWKGASKIDAAMVALCALVTLAIILP